MPPRGADPGSRGARRLSTAALAGPGGAWPRAQAWLSPPGLVLGPPGSWRSHAVFYPLVLVPHCHGDPTACHGGPGGPECLAHQLPTQTPAGALFPEARCTSAGLGGGVGPRAPSPRPQGRAHITTSTPKYPEETTRCPWVQGGSASLYSCAESQLLIFRAVSPASGSELPEWGRCDPAPRADLRGSFPSPGFWSLSVAVK